MRPVLVLFLKTTLIVSPTSARMIGPREPRCCHSGAAGFLVVKVASVYSTYRVFLYWVPIWTAAGSAVKLSGLVADEALSKAMRRVMIGTSGSSAANAPV